MKELEPTLIFKGRSMHPLLKDGDRLTIRYFQKPRPLDDLELGQVVLLRDQSEWLVHRVVQVDSKKFTKGDWSMMWDEPTMVWGEVVKSNGRSTGNLKSLSAARWSARIRAQRPRWLRRWARLQLYLLAFWKR